MNISELYKLITTPFSSVCYPFSYKDSDDDFLGYVYGRIEEYTSYANSLDQESLDTLNHLHDFLPAGAMPQKGFDFHRDVNAIADIVIKSLNESYRSFHEDTFRKFKKFFHKDDCFYLKMLPQMRVTEKDVFYRMRTDKIKPENGDGELFHIPFELRHLASTQRYSIPGYTALYLGGNLFTSWTEMNKPKMEGCSFAGFKFKEEQLFIDLGYPYKEVCGWELYSLFAMYPLLIACMVDVRNPDAPFKPEYIMPQLMMKLVREHTKMFTGITYMSNKVPVNCNHEDLCSRNYVVCVNNAVCKEGYDKKLAKRMQISDIVTLDRKTTEENIKYKDGKYIIDFSALESLCTNYHDMNVKMIKL